MNFNFDFPERGTKFFIPHFQFDIRLIMRFSQGSLLVSVVVISALGIARAECPNACSGHGQCGSHDMCTCDRNWQGSDCSLREFELFQIALLILSDLNSLTCFITCFVGTCPFGRAHVDTPKGDLDASLIVGDHSSIVLSGSTVYPYGTSEGYPFMADTTGAVMTNTAHDYMECSNKGLCDRETGQCECLPGYDGAACQRASCPSNTNSLTPGSGVDDRSNIAFKIFNGRSSFTGRAISNAQVNQCSGHGTCMTLAQLAFLDNSNTYDLWDKKTSMGCKCDPGYVFISVLTFCARMNRLCHHSPSNVSITEDTQAPIVRLEFALVVSTLFTLTIRLSV